MPLRETVEDVLYPIEPFTPQVRSDKQMKVLALGLSRMGTESLRQALQILGYDHVYHGFDVMYGGPPSRKAWSDLGRRKYGPGQDSRPITREDLDRILGHCEAVTDQPCACFALELIEAYPDAKVVLNYRDVEPWYRSVTATFTAFTSTWEYRYLSFFDPTLYWRKQSFVYYQTGLFQGSISRNARRVHKEHHAMVKGSVAADRLLEWTIGDGWEPLCEFLGKPVPAESFPEGNTPVQLMEKSKSVAAKARARAYRNLAVTVVLTVGVLVGAVTKVQGKTLW